MLSGCPELEAQKRTLSQFQKLKKDTLCQSWKLKKAPCPAEHLQYFQVWKCPPPHPQDRNPADLLVAKGVWFNGTRELTACVYLVQFVQCGCAFLCLVLFSSEGIVQSLNKHMTCTNVSIHHRYTLYLWHTHGYTKLQGTCVVWSQVCAGDFEVGGMWSKPDRRLENISFFKQKIRVQVLAYMSFEPSAISRVELYERSHYDYLLKNWLKPVFW